MASDQDRQRAEKRFKQEFPFYLFDSSDANAFRTFDWDNPNCRAIRDGVMPVLKAARHKEVLGRKRRSRPFWSAQRLIAPMTV
jgi:hypothetical protein